MKLSSLSKGAAQALDQDREIVETIRYHHLPDAEITKTSSDLPVLQTIAQIPPHFSQTREAVAVGTALGDVFANELGLHWVEFEDDDLGKSLALQYQSTCLILFPRTMVLKRIERNEDVDMHFMFNAICQATEEIKEHVDEYQLDGNV